MAVNKEEFKRIHDKLKRSSFQKRNIITSKAFSLDYLSYRIQRPIFKIKSNVFQKKNPKKPWLAPAAIEALELLIKPTDFGLEYGSGRSTIFFAPKVHHLTSVEHHKGWYEKVSRELKHNGIDNVDYIFAPPNKELPQVQFTSETQHFTPTDLYPIPDDFFTDYINVLDRFPNEKFDFILIDGRARTSSSFKALAKLKPGGLLILDQSERIRYQTVIKALSDWEKIYTTTGLTDTTIWRKP